VLRRVALRCVALRCVASHRVALRPPLPGFEVYIFKIIFRRAIPAQMWSLNRLTALQAAKLRPATRTRRKCVVFLLLKIGSGMAAVGLRRGVVPRAQAT
jgi:hypothetical protein